MTTDIATPSVSESIQNTNESTASPSVETPTAPTEAVAKPVEPARHERTYTRDELAKIANAESKKSYEKGRQEAIESYKREQAQKATEQPSGPQTGLTDEELEARVERIAQKKAVDAQLLNEAKSFHSKLDLDNDVDMKLHYEKLNLDKMPMPYVHILNSVDNARDVIREFGKFPEKLTTILNTANLFGLDAGKDAIRRVSESIKKNQAAAEVELPKAPISQVSPSNTSVDNGQMTAADYRKKYAGRY